MAQTLIYSDGHQHCTWIRSVLACRRCSFNGRLGILERHGSNAGLPDACAVVQGLAVWLQSQDLHHLEVSLLAYIVVR